MEVTINARHGKLSESLRNQAMLRFNRIERLDARITAGTLVIDEAANGYRAEVRLMIVGGPPLIGHAEASTQRTAIAVAFERARNRLKRRRGRANAQRTRRVAAGGQGAS